VAPRAPGASDGRPRRPARRRCAAGEQCASYTSRARTRRPPASGRSADRGAVVTTTATRRHAQGPATRTAAVLGCFGSTPRRDLDSTSQPAPAQATRPRGCDPTRAAYAAVDDQAARDRRRGAHRHRPGRAG
jgi:hypothetical protein